MKITGMKTKLKKWLRNLLFCHLPATLTLTVMLQLSVTLIHAGSEETPAHEKANQGNRLDPSQPSPAQPSPASKASDGNREKEEPAQANKAYRLEDTVVVSSRTRENAFLSDRSVSVLGKQKLFEESPRTTPEALYRTPGVFVQETNYGGGSPIIRGLIGPQILIMVDGVRFNNAVYRTGPLQYLNLIDPLSLERIEVLRGPGSVLYGSDAMGGVIEAFPSSPGIFTDTDRVRTGAKAYFRYSSADRGRVVHGDFDAGKGGFGILGGGTYKKFDDVAGGRGVGVQPFSGYENGSASAVATRYFSKGDFTGWHMKLAYLFNRISNAGRTDKLYDKKSLQIYDNDDHLIWGRLHMESLPCSTQGEYTFSFQDFLERKDTIKMADDRVTRLDTTRDEVTDRTMGHDLSFLTPVFSDTVRIQYGLMWYRDWVGSERMARPAGGAWAQVNQKSYPDGSTYDNYGGFLLVDGEIFSTPQGHSVCLGGGYRMHGMAGRAPSREGLPEVDFSHTGHVFQANAQYLYRDVATASLTFSQGFRSPNLQEAIMLGDTGKFFHTPNADLEPESVDTLELLTRARVGRLRLSQSVYVSFLDDLIKREGSAWQGKTEVDGKPVVMNVNGKRGILWGAEAGFLADLGCGLSLNGNISYTWGEEHVPDGEDVPLTRIPPLFGSTCLRYTTHGSKWNGFVETGIRAAAGQDRLSPEDEEDARIPQGGTPGWWTWNLRAGFEAWENVRVALSAENLLDKKYKYHASGIFASGINVLLTLELFY